MPSPRILFRGNEIYFVASNFYFVAANLKKKIPAMSYSSHCMFLCSMSFKCIIPLKIIFSIAKHTTEIQYVSVMVKLHFNPPSCRSEGLDSLHIVKMISVISRFKIFRCENSYFWDSLNGLDKSKMRICCIKIGIALVLHNKYFFPIFVVPIPTDFP
jgi:hypothetical protein